MWAKFLLVVFFSLLSACSWTDQNYAPVTVGSTIEAIPKNGNHRVKRNETLYSIAWRYGLDYRYLARRNHINPPYHIEPHQVIYLRGKLASTAVTIARPLHKVPVMARVTYWHWPAAGLVVGSFSPSNKGINIKGRLNDPVFATAAGKIVYSGSGLRGYGNLIIIKHNSSFLTAYAHNSKVVVKIGDSVKAGQKIAEMGHSGSQQVMLHFEIRYNGQPVNPLSYLGKKLGG